MNFKPISKSSVINVNSINRATNIIPRITNSLVTQSSKLYLPGIKSTADLSENSFSPNDLLALIRRQNGFDFYNSFCRITKSGSSLNGRKSVSTYKTAGKYRKFLCPYRKHNSKEDIIELLRKGFIRGKIPHPIGAYFCEKTDDSGRKGTKSKTSKDDACQIKKERIRQHNIDIYNIKTNIDGLYKSKIKKDDPCKPKEELQHTRVVPIPNLPELPEHPRYTDYYNSDKIPFEMNDPCNTTPITKSNRLSKSCDPCTEDCSFKESKRGTVQQNSIGKEDAIIKKTPNIRYGKISYYTHKTRKYSSKTSDSKKKLKLASKGQASSSAPQNNDNGSMNVGGDGNSSGHASWKNTKCKKMDFSCPPKKGKPLITLAKPKVCYDICKALEAINEMQSEPCKQFPNKPKTLCKMVDGKIVCQIRNTCCVLEKYDPSNPKHKNIPEPNPCDTQFCCKIEDVFCVCTRIEKKGGQYVASSDGKNYRKLPRETPKVSNVSIKKQPSWVSSYQDFKERMTGVCDKICTQDKTTKKGKDSVNKDASKKTTTKEEVKTPSKLNKLSKSFKKNQLEPKAIPVTPSPCKDRTTAPLTPDTLCETPSKVPDKEKAASIVCTPQNACAEMVQSLKSCKDDNSKPQDICKEDVTNKPCTSEKKPPCKICGDKIVCELEDKTCVCEMYNPCNPEHRDPPKPKVGDTKSICKVGNLRCECDNKAADIFESIKKSCQSTKGACKPSVSGNGNNAQPKNCKMIEGKLVLELKNTCCVCEKFNSCNPEHTDIPRPKSTDKIASCVIENMYCNCINKSDINMPKEKRNVNADCLQKDKKDRFFQAIFDKIKLEREARACLTNKNKNPPAIQSLNCKKASDGLLAEICKINKANSTESKAEPVKATDSNKNCDMKDSKVKLNSKACRKLNWKLPAAKKANPACDQLSNAISESIQIASKQQSESKDMCANIRAEDTKCPKVEQSPCKPTNLYNNIAKYAESPVKADPCSDSKQDSSKDKFKCDAINLDELEKACQQNTKSSQKETQPIDPCKSNDPCSPKKLNKTKINDPCISTEPKGLADSCISKVNSSLQEKGTSEKPASTINLYLKIKKSKKDNVCTGETSKPPINIYVNVDLVNKTEDISTSPKPCDAPSNLKTNSKSSTSCISQEPCKPSFDCKEQCKPSFKSKKVIEDSCAPKTNATMPKIQMADFCKNSKTKIESKCNKSDASKPKINPCKPRHNSEDKSKSSAQNPCIDSASSAVDSCKPKKDPCIKVDPCNSKENSSRKGSTINSPCIENVDSKSSKVDPCKPKIDPCEPKIDPSLKIKPCKPTFDCGDKSGGQKTVDLCSSSTSRNDPRTIKKDPRELVKLSYVKIPCTQSPRIAIVDQIKAKDKPSKGKNSTTQCIPNKTDLCTPKSKNMKQDPCKFSTYSGENKSDLCGEKTPSKDNKSKLTTNACDSKADPCKDKADISTPKENLCSPKLSTNTCESKVDPCAAKLDPCAANTDPCKAKADISTPKENLCSPKLTTNACESKADPCAAQIDPCKPKVDISTPKEDLCSPKLSTNTCDSKVDPCAANADPCKAKTDICTPKEDLCSPKLSTNTCDSKVDLCAANEDPCKTTTDICAPKENLCKPKLTENACDSKENPCATNANPCKPKANVCTPKENPCKPRNSSNPSIGSAIKKCEPYVNPCENKEAQLDKSKSTPEPCKVNESASVKYNLEIPCKDIKKEVPPDQCAEQPRVVISDMCKNNSNPCKPQYKTSPSMISMCTPLPEAYKRMIEECKPSTEIRTPKTKISTQQESPDSRLSVESCTQASETKTKEEVIHSSCCKNKLPKILQNKCNICAVECEGSDKAKMLNKYTSDVKPIKLHKTAEKSGQFSNELCEESKITADSSKAKVDPIPNPSKDNAATTKKEIQTLCGVVKDESETDICKYSPCNPEAPFNLKEELKTNPTRYNEKESPIDPCCEKTEFCVKCEDLLPDKEVLKYNACDKNVSFNIKEAMEKTENEARIFKRKSCENTNADPKNSDSSKSTLCTMTADTLQYPCPPPTPPEMKDKTGSGIFSFLLKPHESSIHQEIKDPKLYNQEMVDPKTKESAPVMENNLNVKMEEPCGSGSAIEDPRQHIAQNAISRADKLKNLINPPHSKTCKRKNPCDEEKMIKVEMSEEMCRKLKGDPDKKVCMFEVGESGKGICKYVRKPRGIETGENIGKGTCYEDSCKDVKGVCNHPDCRPAPRHDQPPFKLTDCPEKQLNKEPQSESDILTFPTIPPPKIPECEEPPNAIYPHTNMNPPRGKTNMTCNIDDAQLKLLQASCDKPSATCCKEDSTPLRIKCDNYPHCSAIYDATKHKEWNPVQVIGEPQVAGGKTCVQYIKKKQEYDGSTSTVMPNLQKILNSPRFDVTLSESKEAEKESDPGTKGLIKTLCKVFCPKKKGDSKSQPTGITSQDLICEGMQPKADYTILPECDSEEDRKALRAKTLKQWPFLEQRHDDRPNLLKGCQTMHDKQAYMANKRKCKPNPIDIQTDDPVQSRSPFDPKNTKWRKC